MSIGFVRFTKNLIIYSFACTTLLGAAACTTNGSRLELPNEAVMSWVGLAPFPQGGQLGALQNPDPNLDGKGCKRALTPDEAVAFERELKIGMPFQLSDFDRMAGRSEFTIADLYTIAVIKSDGRFAGLVSTDISRDFEGNFYRIGNDDQIEDYFRIEFAARELLAAKGCVELSEIVSSGLNIPA